MIGKVIQIGKGEHKQNAVLLILDSDGGPEMTAAQLAELVKDFRTIAGIVVLGLDAETQAIAEFAEEMAQTEAVPALPPQPPSILEMDTPEAATPAIAGPLDVLPLPVNETEGWDEPPLASLQEEAQVVSQGVTIEEAHDFPAARGGATDLQFITGYESTQISAVAREEIPMPEGQTPNPGMFIIHIRYKGAGNYYRYWPYVTSPWPEGTWERIQQEIHDKVTGKVGASVGSIISRVVKAHHENGLAQCDKLVGDKWETVQTRAQKKTQKGKAGK